MKLKTILSIMFLNSVVATAATEMKTELKWRGLNSKFSSASIVSENGALKLDLCDKQGNCKQLVITSPEVSPRNSVGIIWVNLGTGMKLRIGNKYDFNFPENGPLYLLSVDGEVMSMTPVITFEITP